MATIEELTETIVKFRDERDWAQSLTDAESRTTLLELL